MGKMKRYKMDRSEKSIVRESEKNQRLKRTLKKHETWVRCQCPHSTTMLRPIESKNPEERLYQCTCGKIINMSRIEIEDGEKAFKTVDNIIDQLKISAKLGTDDGIMDHLAAMQYNLIGLQTMFGDYRNAVDKKKRSGRRDWDDRGDGDGRMNIDPKIDPFK